MRATLLLAAVAACTPDFAAPSDVFDLRVLAIRADPPEAQYDLDAGTIDPVHVTVLAVDPPRKDNFATMVSELCGQTDTRRCDTGASFPLGTQRRQGGETFSLDIVLPPGTLTAGVAADKLAGLGGIRVQLAVAIDDGDPNAPLHAAKTIIYSPKGRPPNRNPLMTGVQLTRDGQDAGVLLAGQPPSDPCALPGCLLLTPGLQTGLRPILAPDAREEYDTTDLRGNTVHLRESPNYSFFVTAGGSMDRDTAYEPLDGGAPPDGLARIEALSGASGTLWIVVRDGRGGESWLSFPWSTPRAPRGARRPDRP
jgi:hypothetical protein